MRTLLFALLLLMTAPALAASYTVNHAASRIEFTGTHAGEPFRGTFDAWLGKIAFDPAAPEKTTLRADIDMTRVSTGNKMFDGTLPSDDWFDVKNHPKATFKSTAVAANPDGSYQVTGDLTLRGITQPVSFAFVLDDAHAAIVTATASFNVDRLSFDIGKKSDPKAEWVGRDIALTLKVNAERQTDTSSIQ